MSTDVLISIISTLGLVVVALIGRQQISKSVRRRRARRAQSGETVAEVARAEQADAALADYQNDPAAFVERVLTDNAQKHEEIQSLREDRKADREEFRQAIAELRREISDLRDAASERERADVRFRSALSHWLRDVFAAWGQADQMPRPRSEDEPILRPVLPWGPYPFP